MAKAKHSEPIPASLRSLAVSVSEVSLWDGNYRDADVGAIAESLREFGQQKPIIAQRSSGRIVAGNGVYRAASALGWTEIAVIYIDLDDTTAKKYLVADNRTHQLGSNDDLLLVKMLADIAKNDTLVGTGYDDEDLADLLAKVGRTGKVGRGDPDASKALPEKPWVQPGMVFQLGEHRVACGDGSDWNLLDKLMGGALPDLLIVQPPAGKGQEPKDLFDHFASVPEQFWFEPHRYDLWQAGPDLGLDGHGSFIVWDKMVESTHRDYAEAFELVYSSAKHPQALLRHTFVGAADGEAYGGPDFNERPTALFSDLMERWSPFEASVLDPFALGATCLLAAERSSKRYFGVKREPAHAQSLLEKWQEYSGLEPELIE